MRKITALILIGGIALSPLSIADEDNEDNEAGEVPELVEPTSLCYSDVKKSAEDWFNSFIPDVCANINTTPDIENSRYRYENPNGGCDLGLELPGLPAWGANIAGLNSCQIARAITGDMVDSVNEGLDGVRSFVEEGIENAVKDSIGIDLDEMNVDLNQIATDAVD